MRAFSTDGRQLWQTRLAGANLEKVTPINGGRGLRMALDNGSGGSNGAGGVAVDAAGYIVVGVGNFHVRGGEREITYEERWLRAADGPEIGRSAARGVIRIKQGGRRYAFRDELSPRVLIY